MTNRREFLKLLIFGAVAAPFVPLIPSATAVPETPPTTPVTTVGYAQISDHPLTSLCTDNGQLTISHYTWEGNTYQGAAAPIMWRQGRRRR